MAKHDDKHAAFQAVLEKFSNAMLVTHDVNGELHGRPMAIADVSDDGTIWFLTSGRSGKTAEIQQDHDVLVTCQSATAFLTINGRGVVIRDKARLQAIWKKAFEVWFPDGPEGDDAVLIKVMASAAEYWDRGGLNALRYGFDAAKSYVKGERPTVREPQEHGKVDL